MLLDMEMQQEDTAVTAVLDTRTESAGSLTAFQLQASSSERISSSLR